jgi:DNA-binding transcriptional MerR regulator
LAPRRDQQMRFRPELQPELRKWLELRVLRGIRPRMRPSESGAKVDALRWDELRQSSAPGAELSVTPVTLGHLDTVTLHCHYSRVATDYTLQHLADLADVTPRTIRYYIAQGLLPSPGAGAGTRYGEHHLERLQTIKRMQRAHLPLAEIRAQLARGSATDYIASVLHESAPRPRSIAAPAMAAFAPAPAWLPSPRHGPQPDRSQWDRIALSPDVELHIRRPLTRDHNRRVDRLIALARELLQEDQP